MSRSVNMVLAGFGGQGVLFAGKLIAYAGLLEDREVSWLPSYGPEMRGGTANCSVCLSDDPIGSPLVLAPDVLVAMNQPSLDKFEASVAEGGIVVANRYTTSNAVHQASKLPEGERQAFLDWLFDLEYGRMGLPAPDLVLYLDLPTEVSEKMLRHREQATATAADIHEQDGAYLRRCREGAREIARDLGWSVIDCAAGDAPRTVEDIRREVLSRVEPLLN